MISPTCPLWSIWQKHHYLSYCSEFLFWFISTDGVRDCNLFHTETTENHLYLLKASLLPLDSKCSRTKYIAKDFQGSLQKVWDNQSYHLNCFPAKKKTVCTYSKCADCLGWWEVIMKALPTTHTHIHNTQELISFRHLGAFHPVSSTCWYANY